MLTWMIGISCFLASSISFLVPASTRLRGPSGTSWTASSGSSCPSFMSIATIAVFFASSDNCSFMNATNFGFSSTLISITPPSLVLDVQERKAFRKLVFVHRPLALAPVDEHDPARLARLHAGQAVFKPVGRHAFHFVGEAVNAVELVFVDPQLLHFGTEAVEVAVHLIDVREVVELAVENDVRALDLRFLAFERHRRGDPVELLVG